MICNPMVTTAIEVGDDGRVHGASRAEFQCSAANGAGSVGAQGLVALGHSTGPTRGPLSVGRGRL
jgi:hypothetical protein